MPPPPDADAEAGAAPPVVPGYTLQELLGRGGSGEVWRAVPRGGGAAVAVKVLRAGDPERQAREAALLGELDHPHLVRVHEVVHQPRRGDVARVALVLDLLPGGSLAALLARRGRLRSGEVVTAIAPVAAALAHAHEHGVVHGDLSPGNIVFTAEGRPVLTDLGVARVLCEDPAGEVTPAYVDPTVARGGAAGPASDVFGVAAAAFHALTGIPPWNGARPADVLAVAAEAVLPDLAELAPGAPAELRAVISRGLAAAPHDRGSAAAFALDLRHACTPEPVRLPAAGVADSDLARTGAGPRTELTHLVPGRRRGGDVLPDAPPPGRRRALVGLLGPVRALARGFARRGEQLPALLPRRVLALALVGAGLAVAGWTGAWVGAQWGRDPAAGVGDTAVPAAVPAAGDAGASAEPRPSSSAPDVSGGEVETPGSPAAWRAVVAGLYARRAEAFTTGSAAPLARVHRAGSTLLDADERYLAALADAGRLLRGFAPEVVRVEDATSDGRRAEVRVVDRWPAYDVVTGGDGAGGGGTAGTVVRSVEGRGPATVLLVLVRGPGGWLIDRAERAP